MDILSKVTEIYKKDGIENAYATLLFFERTLNVSEKDVLGFIELLKNNNENLNRVLDTTIVHEFPSPSVIKAFVKAGGDINFQNSSGLTPLEYYLERPSIDELNPDVLKAFFENGAKPDTKRRFYVEMILNRHHAGDLTGEKAAKLLKLGAKYGADIDCDSSFYHKFIGITSCLNRVNDPVVIETLIKLGYNPNRFFENMSDYLTPLLYEIRKLDINKIELLLKNGADPNFRDPKICNQHSPLWFMTVCSFPPSNAEEIDKLTELLTRYGADVNVKDEKGCTLLNYSHSQKIIYVPVRTLLKYGASVEASPRGDTPLHAYVKRVPPDCVREDIGALLEAGVDLEAKNGNGKTAFAEACLSYVSYIAVPIPEEEKRNYYSLFRTLVELGADINAQEANGCPAINFLPEDLREELIKLAEYRDTVRAADAADIEIYER